MIEKKHHKKIGIKKIIAVFLVFCMMVCYFPPFIAKASSTDVQVVGIHKESTKDNIRIVLDTLPVSDTTYSGFTVDIIGGQVNVEKLLVDVTSDADNCITLSIGNYLTEETNYQVTLKGSATDTTTGATIHLADDLQIHVDSSGVVYEEIPTDLWPGIKHDANSKGELYMQSEDLSSRVDPYEQTTDETPEVVQLPGFEYVTISNFYDASGVQMADSVTADADSEKSEIIVPYTTLKNSEGTELKNHDKTLLSLKVDFEENTRFMTNSNLMVAASQNYVGFLIRPESNNQLRIEARGVQSSSTVYYVSTDKVDSMTGGLILQISFVYGDFDNDNNGTADDVKLGVYINGATCTAVLDGNVADGEITSDNHLMFYNCDMTKLGTQMVLNTLNRTEYNTGDVTVSKVTSEKPKMVALNGFEYVTTSNFYDASGEQMADRVTADADAGTTEIIVPYTTLKNSEGEELSSYDKTLLSLSVDFEENTTYMTSSNLMVAASSSYVGLLVRPENNNQLRIQTQGGVQSSSTVYYLSTDKVSSMTDEFILQFSFEYGDFDNDNNGAADDVKLGVYINGASCTAEIDGNVADGEITSDNHLMFYNCDMTKLGTQMVLNTLSRAEYSTGDITVSKAIAEKPEIVALDGFEHVTTSNFYDASGVQMADEVTADADAGAAEIAIPYTTLKNGEGTVLTSHDKTLLSLCVDFEENTSFITNVNLMVAAAQNWLGFLVRPANNNELRIQTYGGVQSSPTVYFLTTDKVASMAEEFILQFSFEYGDFDNDNNGTADDVKLGVYINGAPCTAVLDGNTADGEITSDNHLMFYNCDMTKLGTQMVLNTLSRAENGTGDITVSKVAEEDNGSRYTLQPIGMDDGVFIQQADGTEESYSFESFTLKDSQFVCLKYSDATFEDGTIFHIKGAFKLLHTSGTCYKDTYNKAIRFDVKYQYENEQWRRYDEIGSSTLVPGYQYNAGIQSGDLYMIGTDPTSVLPDYVFRNGWDLCLKPLNEASGVFRKPSGGEEIRLTANEYTFLWPANITRQYYLGVGDNKTEGDIFTIRGDFEVVTGSGGTYYKDDNYVKVLTIEESNYRYDGTTWTCLSSPKATVKIAGGNLGNHSNNTEIYLDSSIEFQIQGWESAKAIRALSNDENSGVFLNDVKQTNSYLLETGSEGLFLSIGGATVQNGDKITLKGAFQQDAASADGNKEIVTYEESNFWYGTDIPQKGSEETLSTWYDYPIGTSDITGDIDADGEVNVVDLVRMKRWYAGQRVPIKNSDLSTTISHASEESEMIAALQSRILRSDKMPIIGYYGPLAHGWNEAAGVEDVFPNFLTDYYFGLIADAGINTIMYSNDCGKEEEIQHVIKSLELAQKYGIGYYLWDTSVGDYAGKAIDKDALAQQIAKYSSYPAFKGLHLVDEPNSENYLPNHFDDATTEDVVENKYISKHLDLVTALDEINVNTLQAILPCYDYDESTASQYEQYVDEYCRGFKPKLLTYDHYVFDKLQTNEALEKDVYFWNMGVIREYAEKYNIPFGVTIQAGGQWNDAQDYFESKTPYYPTEGQFNWNVNTCLAFGTKAITYFPLIQPYHFSWAGASKEDKKFDFDRNGMIGADGKINDWYAYAQKNNKQIAAVDDILMYSENKGLLACGTEAQADLNKTNSDYVLEGTTFHELSSVDGNALIGCFDFEGKTVLYVVNYDMESQQNITLNFGIAQNIDTIQGAKTVYHKTTNQLVLNMEAGEGALVLIH